MKSSVQQCPANSNSYFWFYLEKEKLKMLLKHFSWHLYEIYIKQLCCGVKTYCL